MSGAPPEAAGADRSSAPAAAGEPALTFRALRPDDVPALVALERRIFGSPWDPASFEAFLRPDPPWSRVALAGDEVVAYALGWCAAGEAELMNLAVAPERRGAGLGARLLRWALDHCAARGARRLSLEVRASNEVAQALYRAHGFVEVARRRGYYRRPREDALVMCVTLPAADCAAGPD